MTMQEAIAHQPQWVQLWMNWMMVGAFILPLGLFFWKQTRLAAVLTIISGVLAAIGTSQLYDRLGYVKLLGLPHLFFWTPLAIYFICMLRNSDNQS